MKLKLRLDKKTAAIVGGCLFLLALGILVMTTFEKINDKNSLETQLTSAQERLKGIKPPSTVSQAAGLQAQFSQLSDNLTALKANLTKPLSSSNATSEVFAAANNNNLIVNQITSSELTNESLEGVMLSDISITAKVQGKVSKIKDFVIELNNRLKPSAIKSVDIIIPEATTSINQTISAGDNATANIELVIYTYRGE